MEGRVVERRAEMSLLIDKTRLLITVMHNVETSG
jgi:hypothetical protein